MNFQLQLTPFSAVISLKKAFIKDQNGSYVLPNKSSERKCDDKDSQDAISFSKYEKLEAEYISACKTIEALKRQIVKQEMKDENNAAIQIEAKPEVNSYISAADSKVADGPTASDKTFTKKKSKFSNKISTDIVIKEKEFEPNIENYDSADSLSKS